MLDYLQLSHQTAKNRFPKIFETTKKLKSEAKRILSFGCSSGEECFTLAELFPEAEIVGVDIDYYSIQRARQNNKNNKVFFHTELGATGNYDIITALMVLFSLERPVPKENWEETIVKLDQHLNEGGILSIYTSDYNFADTKIAEKYDIIRKWRRVHPKNKKKYWSGYFRKLRNVN